ncbi:MAG: hypothetical protein ACTSVI_02230 [Promethearchaeota archaeon]
MVGLKQNIVDVTCLNIKSMHGNDTFLLPNEEIARSIKNFLEIMMKNIKRDDNA